MKDNPIIDLLGRRLRLAALDMGFDVICDKPMTNTVEEAEKLHRKVLETGRIFCLTHNYTGKGNDSRR